MYSNAYYKSVENSMKYHLKKDVYSGVATMKYHFDIKELVDKHNAKSLLDYGCGKAFHYFNLESCKAWRAEDKSIRRCCSGCRFPGRSGVV